MRTPLTLGAVMLLVSCAGVPESTHGVALISAPEAASCTRLGSTRIAVRGVPELVQSSDRGFDWISRRARQSASDMGGNRLVFTDKLDEAVYLFDVYDCPPAP